MHRYLFSLISLLVIVTSPVAAAIRGTVMTVDGKPLAGVELEAFVVEDSEARAKRLLSDQPQRVPTATATSDAKGNFVVETKKKEPFIMLHAEASGYAPSFARLRGEDEIVIALAEATSRTGTIRSDGKPVRHALVVWSGRGELTVVTDEEGRYSIPDPEKWANRLTVIHPDYAILTEAGGGRFGRKLSVDQTLHKGTTLAGTAVAEDGKTPIAKAKIVVDGWPVGETADDGTFTIERVSDKWREIELSSGTLIGGRSNVKGAFAPIKLLKSSSVSGNVRDLRTQVPLAGAYVTLADAAGFEAASSRAVIADAKGNFTFRVRSGKYRLSASLPGFQVTPAAVDAKPREAVLKNITGTEEARVTGYAVDELKKPVAAARIAPGVMPMQMMAMGPMMRMTDMPFASYSGPDGKFIARGMATDVDLELHATKRGFPAGKSETMKLTAGEKKSGVIITIARGLEVTGIVKDQRGDPLADVSVTASESEEGGPMMMRRVIGGAEEESEPVKTNAQGAFSMRLKEGKYAFAFRKAGFSPKSLRGKAVSATSQPIEVTLTPGVEIRGRIVRSDGSGVPDVNVNIMAQSGPNPVQTLADGSFTIADLEPGPAMLMATKPDEFIQEMRSVTAPDENLLIELAPTGVVSGKVVDKASKQPVTSFRIGASGSRSSGTMMVMMPPMLKSFVSDDGTFSIENVRLGAIDLVAQAPGYVEGRVTGLRLESGKPLTDVVIELDTGVKVTGKVTGSDGLALSGVAVSSDVGSIMAPTQIMRMTAPTITDANGEYVIEAVAAGEKTFSFAKNGYITEKKETKLSGKEARLDAKLSKGRDVSGVVVTEAGVPVADAGVMAQSPVQGSNFSSGARTDANGAFKFEGLAPGRYAFRVSKSGYSTAEVKDVDIDTHGPVRITLKQGGIIAGRVIGLKDDEIGRATVRAFGSSTMAESAVDATGSYRIEGSPVGSVRVTAYVGSFGASKNTQAKSVQIEPGTEVQVDLEFSSDIVIRGYVSRGGKPAASSLISFIPRQADIQTRPSAQIDSKGNYEVAGLEPGEYDVQIVEMRSFAPYTTTYRVTGSATFDIDIRGAAVQGRVVDSETGQALEDAIILVEAADPNATRAFFRLSVVTDGSGRFGLEQVPEGKYRLRAQKENYGNQVLEVNITSGRTEEVEFRIGKNSGVTLRVIDARDGRALNARILVTDAMNRNVFEGSPRSNAEGDIVLPLEPGTYRASIFAGGYAQRMVTLTSPSSGVRIGMSPGGTLVIESSSSKMLRAKLITASGEEYNRGAGMFMPREIAISYGTNRIENLAPSGYTLQILNDDGSVKTSKPVSIGEGAVTTLEL